MNVVYYSQEDKRWKNTPYTIDGDAGETIGASGCGPTSFAMAASTYLGEEIQPPEMCQYAIKNGYRTANNGTAWGFFASAAKSFGLQCIQTGSLEAAKAALKEGKLVIASMGKGHFTGGGHFILLVGVTKDGWIDVYDPNHDNTKYGADGLVDQGVRNDGKVTAKESVFKSEAKQYWIISNPNQEQEEKELDKAKVIAYGKQIKDGLLIGNTVYVPLRAVAEARGDKVAWDNTTKTATITAK
ncbi:C39 family peptidase [Paenibacillus macerans]|uniref:C39 family peptidase n=1 Tax=Paenibacillus macerans TaxID=44252 RepID=UPI00203FB258|nr:C39 family peptidase [Paenibacillus macerans]MCM3701413.1 C39 family peptidase [Paenibacillus macerans]